MMIGKIKEFVKQNKGIEHSFRFKGARNQIDEFNGVIIGIYHAIFTILVKNDNNRLKSFSYSDLLTSNLEIID